MLASIDRPFYDRLSGEWDALQRWAWLSVHVGVLPATVLLGVALARGRPLLALVLVPLPLGFLYRRYTYA